MVAPAIIPPAIINDPDDDAVLACAIAAKVDLVVSGDPHPLQLAQYDVSACEGRMVGIAAGEG